MSGIKEWYDRTFKIPQESDVMTEDKQEKSVEQKEMPKLKPATPKQQRAEIKPKAYTTDRSSYQTVTRPKPVSSGTTTPYIAPTVSQNTQNTAAPNLKPVKQNSFSSICTFNPQSLEDAKTIIDALNKGAAVTLNLESNDASLTQRIVDVVTGALYILDGSYIKLAEDIYLMAPNGVPLNPSMAKSSSSSSSMNSSKTSKSSSEFTFRK